MAVNKKQAWLLSDAANVEITYDISRIVHCELLKAWQNTTGFLEPYQIAWLRDVHSNLEREWDYWNEEELKMEKNTAQVVLLMQLMKHSSYRLCIFYKNLKP